MLSAKYAQHAHHRFGGLRKIEVGCSYLVNSTPIRPINTRFIGLKRMKIDQKKGCIWLLLLVRSAFIFLIPSHHDDPAEPRVEFQNIS